MLDVSSQTNCPETFPSTLFGRCLLRARSVRNKTSYRHPIFQAHRQDPSRFGSKSRIAEILMARPRTLCDCDFQVPPERLVFPQNRSAKIGRLIGFVFLRTRNQARKLHVIPVPSSFQLTVNPLWPERNGDLGPTPCFPGRQSSPFARRQRSLHPAEPPVRIWIEPHLR